MCGSPAYTAPEIILRKPYGKAVDIWAIGVITFSLLVGYHPFHFANSAPALQKAIVAGKFEFESLYFDRVSREAKDFITCMLVF